MPETPQKAIVIGAGIGGLASAVRLAARGYQVTVYEAHASPGGKLSEISADGFRFDAGPSLFTMPQYVDELFELAGKNPRDYFSYERLEINCRYFFSDGTRITAWADKQRFAEDIAKHTADDAESVLRHLDKSSEIYDITDPVFLQRSLHKWPNYFSVTTLRSLLKFGRIDAFRSMHTANGSRFRDARTVQLFDRYATYNGSDPYKAPATLNIIPHFEQHFGAFFPQGGMYAIVRAVEKLAIDIGVRFCYSTSVDEIIVSGGAAEGVRTGGETVLANVVVSNMDVWYTYRKLLPGTRAPERTLRQERSSSALIFYWGVKANFPDLDLHNIFFSADYKREFSDIWKDATIPSDPTVYINISSKQEPQDAPEGCENWFVMINVPANAGQDWDQLIKLARERILGKLSNVLSTDLSRLIVTEHVLDPRTIDSRTSSYQGALYGTSSNKQLSAFLRHPNFSSKLKGLYFVGGSVHPGGGIPLSLLSARIVADII